MSYYDDDFDFVSDVLPYTAFIIFGTCCLIQICKSICKNTENEGQVAYIPTNQNNNEFNQVMQLLQDNNIDMSNGNNFGAGRATAAYTNTVVSTPIAVPSATPVAYSSSDNDVMVDIPTAVVDTEINTFEDNDTYETSTGYDVVQRF